MARKALSLKKESLDQLRSLVRQKSSLDLNNSADIQKLQASVQKITGANLSIQTLNRFFGLVHSPFNPSKDTLDILAGYLKYKSFKEFEEMNSRRETEAERETERESGGKERQINSMLILTLFSEIESSGQPEKGLLQVVRNIFRIAEHDKNLSKDLYPFMASTSFGRKYFYENYVNIDGINGDFGKGLNHYCLHSSSMEEQLFGHTLLCFKSFLLSDSSRFALYYNKIKDHSKEEIRHSSPYVHGRFLASRVYQQSLTGEVNYIIADLQQEAISADPIGGGAFPWVSYGLAEALILTHHYFEAWELLKPFSLEATDGKEEFEAHYNQLQILKLFAGYFAGEVSHSRALKQFYLLSERPLFFLSESYFSIFLLILSRHLQGENSSSASFSQLRNMIKKTGFVHFELFDKELNKEFKREYKLS